MAPVRIAPGVILGPTGRLLVEVIKRYPRDDLLTVTSGKDGDHGSSSHHYGLVYQGSPTAAIDVVHVSGGGLTTEDKRVMREFSAWLITFSALIVELIHSGGIGYYVRNQRLSPPYAVAEHKDHVHFATSANLANKFLAKLGSPTSTPPSGPTMPVYGVDVSYHNGVIDWPQVRAAGMSFATMKASVGSSVQSYASLGYFKANAPKMRAAVPLVGGYHWLLSRNTVPISVQVSTFIESMNNGLGGYRGYIVQLDAEDDNITATDIKAWMEEWNRRTDSYPVAGYVPDWRPYSAQLSEYGFAAYWASEYVSGTGSYLSLASTITPQTWHSVDGVSPTILQYSSKASVPGVQGYCDANQTKLSFAQLKQLLTGTPSPTLPSPSPIDPEEDDMPKLSDNMTLKYTDPDTGETKSIGITYETYLSLVYQQNQKLMANTAPTSTTVTGDVVTGE